MSDNREFFGKRWESEQPAFGRVLRAVPATELAYRPHERSTSAGDLAWQLAEEARSLVELLEKNEIRWETRPRPESAEDIVTAYESSAKLFAERLAGIDDAKWQTPASFIMGGEVGWTSTIEDFCWGFLFDMVHHRGQLSAYLRPMGGKVPAIYGPSGDDSGS